MLALQREDLRSKYFPIRQQWLTTQVRKGPGSVLCRSAAALPKCTGTVLCALPGHWWVPLSSPQDTQWFRGSEHRRDRENGFSVKMVKILKIPFLI